MAKMKMTAGPQQQTRTAMPMPPPAKLPPGVTRGTPPLPAGRPVVAANTQHLTPLELQSLQQIGWRDGQPVPANMAEILADASQYARAEIAAGREQLPVDPTTPPVQLLEAPTGTPLPPRQQQPAPVWPPPQPSQYQPEQQPAAPSVFERLTHEHDAKRRFDAGQRSAGGNPVASAIAGQFEAQMRSQATPEVAQRIDAAKQLDIELGAPERPATRHTLEPNAPPAAPTPAQTAAANRSEEPVAPLTQCPHCNWDLKQPDDPPPDDTTKQAYLACVLGGRPLVKEVALLGDNLLVTLRTLTFRELDAVFRQVYADQGRGEIRNEMESWERVNRYRMALQVVRVRTAQRDDETPEGLCPKDNATARDHWAADDAAEPLRQVEETVFGRMLGEESIVRVVRQALDRFNRTVARLEAMADNSDFWKATGQRS